MSSSFNFPTNTSTKSKILTLSPRQSGLLKKKKSSSSDHSHHQEMLETEYLDGPQIYSCTQCRTHLTSHDDIISKSFHGRHGRAYLFDHCVNVVVGPAEDRMLMTGLHSVNDIFCTRCKKLIGWTYSRAYEQSQKYKEGKFIIEKIHLYLEENDYDTPTPAGEKQDRWRKRSMSWGSDASMEIIYEYKPSGSAPSSPTFHRTSLTTSPVSTPKIPPSQMDF